MKIFKTFLLTFILCGLFAGSISTAFAAEDKKIEAPAEEEPECD